MAKTRAQKVRAVKQDELRAYVGERNRLDHLFDNIEKIEQLNPEEDQYFDKKLQQLKIANEQRIRLLNKYLPDVKEEYAEQTELPPVVIKLTNATDSTAV